MYILSKCRLNICGLVFVYLFVGPSSSASDEYSYSSPRKFVTTSNDWLHRLYQFFGIESFVDVSYNVMVMSKSDVVATLPQGNVKVMTTLQNRNFIKYLTRSFQLFQLRLSQYFGIS